MRDGKDKSACVDLQGAVRDEIDSVFCEKRMGEGNVCVLDFRHRSSVKFELMLIHATGSTRHALYARTRETGARHLEISASKLEDARRGRR